MKKNKGFTLIEVVITLVILGIGIASVMTVMTSTQKRALYPDMQWVAVKIAEVVMQDLSTRPLQAFPCPTTASKEQDLCYFQDLSKSKFKHLFTTHADDFKNFNISVKLKAINEKFILISLMISHPVLGEVYFDTVKAINHAQA